MAAAEDSKSFLERGLSSSLSIPTNDTNYTQPTLLVYECLTQRLHPSIAAISRSMLVAKLAQSF